MGLPRSETISALAAAGSFLTAFFSYRTAKKVMHIDVSPRLVGEYIFDTEAIEFKNLGKGPALNIDSQKMNRHYVDTKRIVSIELEDGVRTINPGESTSFAFRLKGLKNLTSQDRRFNNFVVSEIAKAKELGIIYDDVYGKRWITKMKLVLDVRNHRWTFETKKIKRYTAAYKIWDNIDSLRFRLTKKIREWEYSRDEKVNETK